MKLYNGLKGVLFLGLLNIKIAQGSEGPEQILDLSRQFTEKKVTFKHFEGILEQIKNSKKPILKFEDNTNFDYNIFSSLDPKKNKDYFTPLDGDEFYEDDPSEHYEVESPFFIVLKEIFNNPHIKKLSLKGTLKGYNGIIMFECMKAHKNNHLEFLDLSHNLNFDTIFMASKSLTNLTALTCLNLSHMDLGDERNLGPKLQKGLANAPSLKALNVSNTKLGKTLAGYIYSGIQRNKSMAYLDISDNPLLEIENSIGRFSGIPTINHNLSIIFKNNSSDDCGISYLKNMLTPIEKNWEEWTKTVLDKFPENDSRNTIFLDLSSPHLSDVSKDIKSLKEDLKHLFNIEYNQDENKLIIRGLALDPNFYPQDPFASSIPSINKEEQKQESLTPRTLLKVGISVYEDALLGKADYKDALFYFKPAADAGLAEAQFNMALLYSRSQGTPTQDKIVNDKIAFEWLVKSAQKEHVESLYFLAKMYEQGQGTDQDFKKAIQFYIKAARKNHAPSFYNLAKYYYNTGKFNEAKTFLMQAAQLGDQASQDLLNQWELHQSRNELMKISVNDQILTAEQFANLNIFNELI